MGTHYTITLQGLTPLFMHHDNIDWGGQMDSWRTDPANRGLNKPGDDRTPAFRWLGACYHDDTHLVLPTANLQTCLMEGGAQVLVPKQGKKTFKAQTQSGCQFLTLSWPLLVHGEPIPWAPLAALMTEPDFETHKAMALEHRFRLDVRRVIVQGQRHIRVRPCFDDWSATGQLYVSDEQMTHEVITQIWDAAGDKKGVGDWRPSSDTPGPYGRFLATVTPETPAKKR